MTLNSIKRIGKVVNGNVYNKELFTLGNHYTVSVEDTIYTEGVKIRRIYVNSDWEESSEGYIPEIYFYDDFYGESKPRFEIQTTSYGSLSVEDVQKVVAGYQEAIEAVKVLTKAFC